MSKVIARPEAPALPEFMGRKVKSVYSGRPGCTCGCRGKHTYHPLARQIGGEGRGYEVEEKECSAWGVTFIINKMIKFAEAGITLDDGESYVAHETATRLYIVYFVD